jgi:hypothetical protein
VDVLRLHDTIISSEFVSFYALLYSQSALLMLEGVEVGSANDHRNLFEAMAA